MENIIWDGSQDKYYIPYEIMKNLMAPSKDNVYEIPWIHIHNFVEAIKNAKGPEETKEQELLKDIKTGKPFNVHDAIRLLLKMGYKEEIIKL